MPTKTILGQFATAEYNAAGDLKFKIISTIDYVLPGDLPDSEIFVHRIVVSNDPKSDKFLRIGNIVDLTKLQRSRDLALSAGQLDYLSADFTVQYDDVTTGTAAKELIQARVDQLIADWRTYNTRYTVPTSIELPTITDNIVEAAKTTYLNAKETDDTAAAALVTAQDNESDKLAASTAAAAAYNAAVAQSNTCQANLALLDSGLGGVVTLRTAIGTLLTNTAAFIATAKSNVSFNATGAPAAYETTYYNPFVIAVSTEQQAGLAVITAARTALGNACAAITSSISTLDTARTTANTQYASAVTATAAASATKASTLAAKTAALAAVLAVCPDYVAP